jgi:uncharacterized membrane protein
MLDLRNVLLTAHILVAMLTIGWLAMHGMVLPRIIRGGPENAGFVRASVSVSEKVGPLSGLVFLLGIWLVLRDGDDAYSFSDGWISASMLLFVVTAVLGGVFTAKAEKSAAAKLAAGQPAPEEARRIALLSGISMLLLVIVVWLMVAKPG